MPMMTALDQAPPIRAATWTATLVCRRLVEAYEIERRLPEPKGPSRGGQSAWPTTSREFSDLTGWATEAREAEWSTWERAKGAHPFEVSRMEEAQDWLAILAEHPGEQRCLRAWAEMIARHGKLRKLLKRSGWPRATFYRRRDQGAARIAANLNSRGVAVR